MNRLADGLLVFLAYVIVVVGAWLVSAFPVLAQDPTETPTPYVVDMGPVVSAVQTLTAEVGLLRTEVVSQTGVISDVVSVVGAAVVSGTDAVTETVALVAYPLAETGGVLVDGVFSLSRVGFQESILLAVLVALGVVAVVCGVRR